MRLGGSQTQTTFIAGIVGVPVSGSPVVVGSSGQLGIQASSIRYKRDIHPMSASSHGLMQLRLSSSAIGRTRRGSGSTA